ncbi:toxin-antitoxin system YwqK family antitoxin [Hyunsoonleella flava]|uniref:Toxin-antitoxin system YwqK family antitoxin n=1 Tax=Hyunsoonleella flava TaxID=2527939 RepID=A0A4Q9FGC7_9FLAO|nr:toxin-antitoxin system YwqK family antitoxin [Hyunsoonleella flava]TBN04899.1 toxin-antitoxin system YwqK family antitoxin [Hyunsoonleella flava]
MKKIVFIFFLFGVINGLLAQTFNQFNENGKRHGVWRKYFEGTKVLRYEGAFSNGKEIGLFKFYKNIKGKAVLSATRQFNDSTDLAEVTFFTSKGKIISKGKMRGKTYVGTWKYYQKDSDKLLTLERYNEKGQLQGKRFVYYENEQVAEETNYTNGLLHGKAIYYSLKGVVLKTMFYVDGELHGEAKFFNPKGELLVEGQYKKGKKHGIWQYYENGKLKETKDFTLKSKYKP